MDKPDKQAGNRDEKGRFIPGMSGNPKGRPKRKTLSETLMELIDQPCPNDANGKTWREVIILATLSHGIRGNAPLLKEIWDRIDGKATQPLEHQGGITVTQEPQEERTIYEVLTSDRALADRALPILRELASANGAKKTAAKN